MPLIIKGDFMRFLLLLLLVSPSILAETMLEELRPVVGKIVENKEMEDYFIKEYGLAIYNQYFELCHKQSALNPKDCTEEHIATHVGVVTGLYFAVKSKHGEDIAIKAFRKAHIRDIVKYGAEQTNKLMALKYGRGNLI